MSTFTIHAIPVAELNQLRATRRDVSGNPVEWITAGGGEPLRCCLRDAQPSEPLLLCGYEPPLPPSPYREIGAVFVHASTCSGPDGKAYPDAWRGRTQVLRAYDDRGWIVDALVHNGHAPETEIVRLLDNPAVTRIHSRNVTHGCFMFAVTRS